MSKSIIDVIVIPSKSHEYRFYNLLQHFPPPASAPLTTHPPRGCNAVFHPPLPGVAIVVVKSLDIMTTTLLPYAATTTTTSSRLANDRKVHYPSFFISAFDDDSIRPKRNRRRGSRNTIRVGTQFCLSIAPTYIYKNIRR